jgi:lipid-A-disaccharide synthase
MVDLISSRAGKNSVKKVLLVTGEASGDLHGSHLVKRLKQLDPSLHIYGIGGEALRKAGMGILFHAQELSVVGIVEVCTRLPQIVKAFQTLKREILNSPPDLLILIDYPDFNMRIAAVARKHWVPVLYYISPQIWAWRQNRVKKIARLVDQMAVIFPFEKPFYEQHGVPVQFVGHPLLDREVPVMDTPALLQQFAMKNQWPIIGLLPGSRNAEIDRLLPVMVAAASLIQKEFPQAQFIIPVAPGIREEEIKERSNRQGLSVTIVKNHLHQALHICHLVLVASGTATLETALMKKPMIIMYRISLLTYLVGRLMVRVSTIGLANIVAGKQIVPELIQGDASPQRVFQEAVSLLKDPRRMAAMEKELALVRELLGSRGASERVASMAFEMLNKKNERSAVSGKQKHLADS